MPIEKYRPEQIVTVLRQIEVAVTNGKSTPQACRAVILGSLWPDPVDLTTWQQQAGHCRSMKGRPLSGVC